MARGCQLDSSGAAPVLAPVIARITLLLLLTCLALSASQSSLPQQDSTEATARRLFEAESWPQLATLLEAVPHRSADLEYYYGMALAHLNRMEEAGNALRAGSVLQPGDKKFPIELAGVAFRQKRYNEARRYLRRALRLDPADPYAIDFLATIYFLQGNLEAALRYWNRVGRPAVEQVHTQPGLHVNPVLLDRAFAFSPAAALQAGDLLATEARLRELEIFPGFRLDLSARPDGKFDASLSGPERHGWGDSKLEGLLNLLGGLPFQQVNPSYFNLRGAAVNVVSMARWDAEKRRALASLSGPFRGNPKWRFQLNAGWRSENWDIRNSFISVEPVVAFLNLRHEEASADITRLVGGRLSWSLGLRVSHRDHRDVIAGDTLTAGLLVSGYQIAQTARLRCECLRLPEKRFHVTAELKSETGRMWTAPSQAFAQTRASLTPHWFPQATGDDFETRWKLQAGRTWGGIPFDELYVLGLDRDNDLLLRGHAATSRGRKGSAPMGRNYLLANWETDKNLYRNGIVSFKLGPFFDSGRITGGLLPGTGEWLFDTGAQARIAVLGFGVTLSYGRDLRTGKNVFYASAGR